MDQITLPLSEYRQLCQLVGQASKILIEIGNQVPPPIPAQDPEDLAVAAVKELLNQHPGKRWFVRELSARIPAFGERQIARAAARLGMTRKHVSRGTLLIPPAALPDVPER